MFIDELPDSGVLGITQNLTVEFKIHTAARYDRQLQFFSGH